MKLEVGRLYINGLYEIISIVEKKEQYDVENKKVELYRDNHFKIFDVNGIAYLQNEKGLYYKSSLEDSLLNIIDEYKSCIFFDGQNIIIDNTNCGEIFYIDRAEIKSSSCIINAKKVVSIFTEKGKNVHYITILTEKHQYKVEVCSQNVSNAFLRSVRF